MSSLFNELGQGFDLTAAFERAVQRTEVHTDSGVTDAPAPYYGTAVQQPLLDDNGSGRGSNTLFTASDPDGHPVSGRLK